MKLSLQLATVALLMVFVPAAAAQTYFDSCSSQTGNSAVMLLTTDALMTVDGVELSDGDEVAAFTTDGICAGAIVWKNAHASLTIWGDDSMLPDKSGLDANEEIRFRIWQADTETEFGGEYGSVSVSFSDEQPFLATEGLYRDGAIMLVASLIAEGEEAEVGTSVAGESPVRELRIAGNYPNPFQGSTTIDFDVPTASDVSISAFNLLGQKVASIYDGRVEAGSHNIVWDASGFPSGLYLLRIESGTSVHTTRAVIAR